MVLYCYQLSTLVQQPPISAVPGDSRQLEALRQRVDALLLKLEVSGDMKMAEWLNQRLGILAQRDTAMLHLLLHDIEKKTHSIRH